MASYPLDDKSNWWGDANYKETGGQLVSMHPDEFLSKARPMKMDDMTRENIEDLKSHIQSGKKLDPLALYPNGKEDGRHRAYAAKELGIKKVPVLIWPKIHKDNGGGITAYHGSPHEFEQFDTSKIGTGEGAQAYGHGLYFAESEPVAKGYKERLAPKANVKSGGQNLTKESLRQIADELELPFAAATTANAFGRLQTSDSVQNYLDRLNQIDREELRKSFPKVADEVDSEHALVSELHRRGLDIDRPNKGHMYEVHIDAHPDHFLDWDKPFSNQSSHVKDALKSSGIMKEYNDNLSDFSTPMQTRNKMKRGENIHAFIEHKMGKDSEKASQFLQFIGIQGIKYLDQQSRDKKRGTRNYVVFDDKRVKVKRRYAEGGDVESETIDLPHSLSELKDWKKTHPLRRDPNFFFTKKESLIEGEPPIAMPANLAEVQAFSKKRADGGKVDKYPLARGQENHLTEMAPDQFLNRARPLKHTEENRETINDFKKAMKKGHKLDPLALYPHNQENGRHRATAAKELGIKKVPVHDYRKRDGGAIVKRALMIISKKA